jgi:hypothetical protein
MKFSQAPSSIIMVRPASFGFNSETAATNAFQVNQSASVTQISRKAVDEFNRMVEALRSHNIDVHVVDDTIDPVKPDAVFPNNWISFHEDGRVIHYPMLAENRRLERSLPVLEAVKTQFKVSEVIDYSGREKNNEFLEGTGSIVFDYKNKKAFACRSARTHDSVFRDVCKTLDYTPVLFDAVDEEGKPIYHTNVLMCVGSKFAVLCLDAIKNEADQEVLLQHFAETNHKVVAISYQQLRSFAGNMIEVMTKSGEHVVLLSSQAFQSLLPGQIDAISKHADMLPLEINTIEQYGGGSVRCMVAGIFNKKL